MFTFGITIIGFGMAGLGSLGTYLFLNRENYIVKRKNIETMFDELAAVINEFKASNEPLEEELEVDNVISLFKEEVSENEEMERIASILEGEE